MNSTFLGDIHKNSLDDTWNGEKIQNIRKLVMEHRYEEAGCKDGCSIIYELTNQTEKELIPNQWKSAFVSNASLKDNIEKFSDDVKKHNVVASCKPITFDIQPIEACNMSCIMCHQKHNNKDKVSVEVINKLFQYKDHLYSIRFQGGEVFADKAFSQYLINLKKDLTLNQKIDVITNGSLLSHEELDVLTQGDNPINFIISMDAIDKDIYQYIRQTKHFDKVKGNIEYLAKLQKDKNNGEFLSWNFVVMKSNFYNIKPAIELAANLNVTLNFGPIIGDYKKENIFEYNELVESDYEQYLKEALELKNSLNAKVNNLETIIKKLF